MNSGPSHPHRPNPGQKHSLKTCSLTGVTPSADKESKTRLEISSRDMNHVQLRQEFSNLAELNVEDPRTFLTHADASDWLD